MLYIVSMLLAVIGAGAILTALAFINVVIGGLINAMVVLTAGPLIDKFLGRRAARGSAAPA